jgi:hypothetical protein
VTLERVGQRLARRLLVGVCMRKPAPREDPEAALPPDVRMPGPRTAQYIAWGVLALVVAAGAVGLFGHGPWIRTTRSGDGLQVEYDRVLRLGAVSDLRLALDRPSPDRVRLALGFDGRRMRIQEIFPEPVRQRVLPDGAELEFESGGTGPAQVALRIVPLQVGRSELRLTVGDRPPVRLTHLVLP